MLFPEIAVYAVYAVYSKCKKTQMRLFFESEEE